MILTFKKLLSITMALLLPIGLTACGSAPSPSEAYALYAEAMETVNQSAGLDIGVSTAITISQNKMAEYTTYSTSLQKQEKDGNAQLDALLTITTQGQSSENEYALDGGKAYVISQEQYKEVDPSLVEQYTAHCQMHPFSEDAVTKVKKSKKNGVKSYVMTLDPSKADELVKSHLNSYQMSTDSVQIEIKEVSVSLSMNKSGEVDEIQLGYLLSATGESSETVQELNAATTYKIVAAGDGVKVNMPDFSALEPSIENSSGT